MSTELIIHIGGLLSRKSSWYDYAVHQMNTSMPLGEQMTAQKTNPPAARTYQVRVLDRAIDILGCFSQQRKELSVPEIVEATALSRPTVIRLVANLERRGFLQRVAGTKRYRLGLRLFELGSIVHSSFSILDAAAAPLAVLEQRLGATILLAVRNGEHSVIVDKRQGVGDGFAVVPMPVLVGNVRPLTYGLIGQIFLASLPLHAVNDLLDRYPLQRHTPYSIKDREQFLARLPFIRDHGYGMEVNEAVEGLMGIAAPIRDFAGETVAALALAFPATREKDEAFMESAVGCLKETAGQISANMGYSDGAGSEAAPDPDRAAADT